MIGLGVGLLLASQLPLNICFENECFGDQDFLVVATTREDAAAAHEALTAASIRFEAAFGVAPGRTAMVLDPDSRPEVRKRLLALGFETVAISASPSLLANLLAPALRPSLEAQMEGMPDAVIDAAVQDFVDAFTSEAFAIAGHEAGHFWFASQFDWPEPTLRKDRYGVASAPDWLDELAAVSVEADDAGFDRMGNLCRRRPETIDGAFLETYFSMTHPTFEPLDIEGEVTLADVFDPSDSDPDKPAVTVSVTRTPSDGDPQPATEPGEVFYPLAAGLVAYGRERSGGQALWGSLATDIAAGGTTQNWLRRKGSRFGLPRNSRRLASDFDGWVEKTCLEREDPSEGEG